MDDDTTGRPRPDAAMSPPRIPTGGDATGRGRPDAVMIPADYLPPGNELEQKLAHADLAERLLGVDRPAGERAYVTPPFGTHRFARRDPKEMVFFPKNHRRAGHERYRWEEGAEGVRLGYFVDEEARNVYATS